MINSLDLNLPMEHINVTWHSTPLEHVLMSISIIEKCYLSEDQGDTSYIRINQKVCHEEKRRA